MDVDENEGMRVGVWLWKYGNMGMEIWERARPWKCKHGILAGIENMLALLDSKKITRDWRKGVDGRTIRCIPIRLAHDHARGCEMVMKRSYNGAKRM